MGRTPPNPSGRGELGEEIGEKIILKQFKQTITTMAKQDGILRLKGTIGNITFSKTSNGYEARMKTSIDANRIATDPVFVRTRENNAEFGRAGTASKVLRTAIRGLLQYAKDNRVTSRMTQAMMAVIKADQTSIRGERNVIDGEAELLEGFECNGNAPLRTCFYSKYTATIDRATGVLAINISAFSPIMDIVAPEGTTHFKIVSGGSAIDFENETYDTVKSETAILPYESPVTMPIVLTNTVAANSTHPLFLMMGIQFFQEVNGLYYPLKNGAYNALSIVKVLGV